MTERDVDLRRPIPVTERNPTMSGLYLVKISGEWGAPVYWSQIVGWSQPGVTHWLPLPADPDGR